jgi:hypothetical protein
MLELHRNRAIPDGEKITKALKCEFGCEWRRALQTFLSKVGAAFAGRIKNISAVPRHTIRLGIRM